MKRSLICGLLLLAAACGDEPDPIAPPCDGLLNIGPDSVVLAPGQGALAFVLTTVTACENADRTIEWVSRSSGTATVALMSEHSARVTGVAAGSTYIVAHIRGAPSGRDSVKVTVVRATSLTLSNHTQADTIDAILRDSLVATVRDALTNAPIAGAVVEFRQTTQRRAVLFSAGREAALVVDTTDAAGRASAQAKLLGPTTGAATITVSYPAGVVSATATFTVLAGQPAAVVFTPNDTSTLVGRTIQLRAQTRDRRGNPLGPADPVLTPLPGYDEVLVGPGAAVTGRRVGQALVRGTTAFGEDTVHIRVFPDILVAGSHFSGNLTIGYLDGSGMSAIGAVVVAAQSQRVDWAPDGATIALDGAYPGGPFGVTHVFLARLDGTSRPHVPAFQNSPGELGPRYSPDGRYIYFSARNSEGGAEIWRATADGDSARRVGPQATGMTRQDLYPTVSGDGRLVAYRSGPSGPTGVVTILDLATGATASTGVSASYLEWLPNEDRLVVVTSSRRLAIIEPDGRIVREFLEPTVSGAFDISRDGRYIVTDAHLLILENGGFIAIIHNQLRRRAFR